MMAESEVTAEQSTSLHDEKTMEVTVIKSQGVAPIKPEFIAPWQKMELDVQYLPKDVAEELTQQEEEMKQDQEGEDGPPPKKKFKAKGRFKKRPRDKRADMSEKICMAIVQRRTCRFGDGCKFLHDVKKFMSTRQPDLGEKCYLYQTYGYCQYGATCLYSKQHLDEDFENMKDETKFKEGVVANSGVLNIVDRDLQSRLRRRVYDFTKSNDIVAHVKTLNLDAVQTKREAREPREVGDGVTEKVQTDGDTLSTTEKDNGLESNRCSSNGVASGNSNSQSPNVQSEEKLASVQSEKSQSVQSEEKAKSIQSEEKAKSIQSEEKAPSLQSEEKAQSVQSEKSSSVQSEEKSRSAAREILERTTNNVVVMENGIDKAIIRPGEKKTIDFRNKLYLAPLTTVGNLPFRRVCKQLGADITCSEMATCGGLLQGIQSEWALLKRHPSEDLFGIQLCGSFPDTMGRAAQLINEQCTVDFVDINSGCPIEMFFKKGEGCGLMGAATKYCRVVKSMSTVLDVPLTVKMRTGIFENKNSAHTLIPRLREAGAVMCTLHGRSREQRYTRLADWDYIETCVKAASPMPLFGNGDILSYEDYELNMAQTGVAGCMIARGALIKPWLFTEIKERRHWDISSSERLDILRDFTNYGLEHWGCDRQGVANTRRFLLEFLSFLYRYIPVGILERVPQRINEKPPRLIGRDDLETLMASPNCADWIRISEMLLGPVDNTFAFLPKHKANAYK